MNRQEKINLARQAGFTDQNAHSDVIVRHSNGSWVSVQDLLENLIDMVEARVLEQLPHLLAQQPLAHTGRATPTTGRKPPEPATQKLPPPIDSALALLKQHEQQIAKAERAACLAVCDDVYRRYLAPEDGHARYSVGAVRDEIRNRGSLEWAPGAAGCCSQKAG